MPYLYKSFPAKEPYNQWLFCGKWPATQGILCICATLYRADFWKLLPARRKVSLVGSLQLKVSFAKQPYKRDDVLQERPVILRSLLILATPYLLAARNHRQLHHTHTPPPPPPPSLLCTLIQTSQFSNRATWGNQSQSFNCIYKSPKQKGGGISGSYILLFGVIGVSPWNTPTNSRLETKIRISPFDLMRVWHPGGKGVGEGNFRFRIHLFGVMRGSPKNSSVNVSNK